MADGSDPNRPNPPDPAPDGDDQAIPGTTGARGAPPKPSDPRRESRTWDPSAPGESTARQQAAAPRTEPRREEPKAPEAGERRSDEGDEGPVSRTWDPLAPVKPREHHRWETPPEPSPARPEPPAAKATAKAKTPAEGPRREIPAPAPATPPATPPSVPPSMPAVATVPPAPTRASGPRPRPTGPPGARPILPARRSIGRVVGRAAGRFTLLVGLITALAVIATGVTLPAVMPAAKLAKATADEYGAIPPLPGFLPKPPERSTIVAADGSTLANLYLNEDRRIVKLKDIPVRMQNAVLAIEDSRFYQHEGVDYQGIARAVVTNAETGGISQGGSTLTQQYVKLVITGGDVTLKRKVQEAVYALELEKRLGKAQILERYLNLAYFGEGVYGVATAAEHYFSKPLKKLTLGEMAALAATIARPETFKPTKVKANTARRALVLNRMRDLGYEKAADTEKARKTGAKVKISKAPDRFPYFYTYIRSQLMTDKAYDKVLGPAGSKQRERAVFQGGLKIHTTLEPTRQKQAERAVKRQLAPAGKGGPTGALASVEPHTGKVVALVGGRDYSKSEVNLAVLGRGGQGYQPGSSFKPFFAIAALEQGLSPRLVLNAPSSVEIRGRHCPKGWRPGGGADQSGSGGRIDMYEATARSVNTYYAQLADKVGPEAGLEVARKLGISGIPKREDSKAYAQWAVCSLVLGVKNVSVLDMAAAYGVLANDGVRCPQYTITKITGPDGKDVWKHKSKCERVLSTRVSRTTTDMMRGGPARGTGTRAQLGRPLAGKTGTAQNYTSAFFDGFTPQLATAVWVGFPGKPKPMGNLFHGGPVMGGTYPALIFRDFMSSALAGKPVRDFPRPPAPPSSPMPDVLGKSAADAKRILEAAGFSVTVTGKGKVVTASSPAPGARVAKGSQVEVTMGDKPKDDDDKAKVQTAAFPTGKTMPSVIGMTLPEAFGTLNGAGIGVQIRGGFGRVSRQSPAAGTRLGADPVATLWAGGRGG